VGAVGTLLYLFKDSYEITATADKTTARTGSAWSNDKKRKLFKHSADIEWAFMKGQIYIVQARPYIPG
jgi:hypothetical protein